MIRREFLMVSSVSALAAAMPGWARPRPGSPLGVGEEGSVPAARRWQAEQQRRERGVPSRQERYRWQL